MPAQRLSNCGSVTANNVSMFTWAHRHKGVREVWAWLHIFVTSAQNVMGGQLHEPAVLTPSTHCIRRRELTTAAMDTSQATTMCCSCNDSKPGHYTRWTILARVQTVVEVEMSFVRTTSTLTSSSWSELDIFSVGVAVTFTNCAKTWSFLLPFTPHTGTVRWRRAQNSRRKEKLINGKERRNSGHKAQYSGTPFWDPHKHVDVRTGGKHSNHRPAAVVKINARMTSQHWLWRLLSCAMECHAVWYFGRTIQLLWIMILLPCRQW